MPYTFTHFSFEETPCLYLFLMWPYIQTIRRNIQPLNSLPGTWQVQKFNGLQEEGATASLGTCTVTSYQIYSFPSLAASESSSFSPLYIIAGFLLECNCLRTPWDTTKLSHNASLRFAGPETLIWQPCTLELNSNNGSVLININLRAERKILALCKHTDPEDYLKMLLYIFISKRANKSDKLIIWFHHISTVYATVGFTHIALLHIIELDEKTTALIIRENQHCFFKYCSEQISCMEAQIWSFF